MRISWALSAFFLILTSAASCQKQAGTASRPQPNPTAMTANTDTLILGAGCFWCVEAVFNELNGVLSVRSGYTGGSIKNPSYKEVCTGMTGHAEVAEIVFDSTKISIDELLEVFWQTHDPTTLNRQGADVGSQYRSAIFYR